MSHNNGTVDGAGQRQPKLRHHAHKDEEFDVEYCSPGVYDDECFDELSDDACTLFVGDLSKSVSEEDLENVFAEYGTVLHVEIKRDKITQNNLGYGFVQFENRQDARNAKQALHQVELKGRRIRLGWAQKNTSLFVFNIPEGMADDRFRNVFAKYGPIAVDKTCVRHGVYGFVRFQHRVAAERARSALDGKVIMASGEVIEVAEDGEDEIPKCRITWGDANTQHNCVHLRFDNHGHPEMEAMLPSSGGAGIGASELVDPVLVFNEDDIAQHFGSCGNVVRVTLPRYSDGLLKGYAFVHFSDDAEGEAAAARSINRLHESFLLDKVKILCNFGKKQQPLKVLQQKKRRISASPYVQPYQHYVHSMMHSIPPPASPYHEQPFYPPAAAASMEYYGFPVYHLHHQPAWIPASFGPPEISQQPGGGGAAVAPADSPHYFPTAMYFQPAPPPPAGYMVPAHHHHAAAVSVEGSLSSTAQMTSQQSPQLRTQRVAPSFSASSSSISPHSCDDSVTS